MQTITVEVTASNGLEMLQELEQQHFIKIVNNNVMDSPALPGKEMTLLEFENWIKEAENAPSVTLQEAKQQWENKRKKLLQLAK